MEVLKFTNVGYDYKQGENEVLSALCDISFSVEEGQFVVLAGANGSGKSTVAKLSDGLIKPTRGTVTAFGFDTSSDATVFEVRKSVGLVFQNPDNQMIAGIVEDDVAFGPENIGLPRAEIIERVEWALNAVGMSEYRKATPYKMSGGQKQRVAIAGVLAVKPRLLILDEATSMLDPKGRREVMTVLNFLNKHEGITVLHITHHMEEAVAADRIIVLNDGRIAMDGTPAEIFADYAALAKNKLALPVATEISLMLKNAGEDVEPALTADALLEELWR